MTADFLLGIDLGTSSTKTVALDTTGRLLASASREYPIHSPQPGWAEQDPEAWVQAAYETLQSAGRGAGHSSGQAAGIGLSGQMHGLVCLGSSGRPLRPAIIWADQRSQAQVRAVMERVGAERLGRWTGNPLAAGFMLASWLWLRENEPETARQTATLLLPKDYLRFRLTGRLGTEPSDASSTGLFDPFQGRWSTELIQALELDTAPLPPVHASLEVAGGLSEEAARACGLPQGTPVVFGGSDQAMQAVGHGVLAPGDVSCTIGTGGQIFAPLDTPAHDPGLRLHLFCHTLPATWHLLAATLSAGLALRWLRDQVFEGHSYADLANLAAQAPPGCEGLLFLPHLVGERTPYMDPGSRAAFTGLTLRHGQAHLVRAVMEGVVMALRQGLELVEQTGAPVRRIIASGGAARHPLWLQLQADLFNRPVYRTGTIEAAATGAALLAATGLGLFPDLYRACQIAVPREAQVIEPNPARAELYNQVYSGFLRLYPTLHTLNRTTSNAS